MTTRLDRFLAYSESRRATVCAIAGILTAGVACADSQLPDATVGFLYLLPILIAASLLKAWQILSTYRTSHGAGLAAVVWDASENLRDREGSGFDSMMATSRVLIGAMSHEIRNLASAAAGAHARLAAECPVQDNERYQVLGTLIRGLEKIASSGLHAASQREAVVTDLGTVLDEAPIVIEPGLRDAGISLIWEVAGALPLVQADHFSLLPVFVNPARNSAQALQACPVREVGPDGPGSCFTVELWPVETQVEKQCQ